MGRGHFLCLLGPGLLLPLKAVWARARSPCVTVLTAPLELGGTWGESVASDVAAVIERMRVACFASVDLLSDHQPEKLRVDDKPAGNPAIWLHTEPVTTAWITVTVGARDWCNLAYQFGHELGHVFCNSWEVDAKPRNPCQWIEEALVEAFSLRGLGFLADDWVRASPFPNSGAYGSSIRTYRETILAAYRTAAEEQGVAAGFGGWFKSKSVFLNEHGGVDAACGAVSTMLGMLEDDPSAISDMGALNRWPGRSGVPLQDYLDNWEKSCAELRAPGRIPVRLRALLGGT